MSENSNSVTVYLSGGLGNQLFQIAAGVNFAQESLIVNTSLLKEEFELDGLLILIAKSRQIRIVVQPTKPSWFFLKSHNATLRVSQIEKPGFKSASIRCTLKICSQVGFMLSGYLPWQIYRHSNMGLTEKLKITEPRIKVLIGYFQEEEIASVIRTDLNRFIDEIFKTEDSSEEINKDLTLVMHVRRGDYLKEEKIGTLSDSYFVKMFEEVSKHHGFTKILFFSNGSSVVTTYFFENFEGPIVFESPHGISALRLLFEMKAGDIYVLSNSTLGWWAAYLNDSAAKIIFAPHPWFENLDEPFRLIPNSWLRYPAEWIGSIYNENL